MTEEKNYLNPQQATLVLGLSSPAFTRAMIRAARRRAPSALITPWC